MITLFDSSKDDSDYWECIKDDLSFVSGQYEITGTLGLWTGVKQIEPVICDSLLDAINKCINSDISDIELSEEDGIYYLDCHHHDGTNHFILEKYDAE